MSVWNGFLLLCFVWAASLVWFGMLVAHEFVIYRRRAKAAPADDLMALADSLAAPLPRPRLVK